MSRLAVASLLCLALASAARAVAIRVEVDGSGDVATIQDALLAAADGDSILIGPGTYTWVNQNTDSYAQRYRGMIQLATDFYPDEIAPNDLVLLGTAGPALTILDALDRGRVFYTSGDTADDDGVALRFTLEGLTFRNGNNADEPVETNRWGAGAATHLASPVIRNCRFISNHAEVGGGLWTGGQNNALIVDCEFRDNTASFGGGAAAVNSSEYMVTFNDCIFEDNSATLSGGAFFGANSQTTMERVHMFRNHADARGSAIRAYWTRPLILRELFVFRGTGANSAIDISWEEIEGYETPVQNSIFEIHHTLVARNVDSGIRIGDRVIATVTCNNSVEHDGLNWAERASTFFGTDGNGSYDVHFCQGQARNRRVCEKSPMLAEINRDCDVTIGMVEAFCSECEVTDYNLPGSQTTVLPSYPNPFQDVATLEFELDRSAHVRIAVYDLKGRRVRLLVDETRGAGTHEESWDGCDDSGRRLASGVYQCKFEGGGKSSQSPMVLLN